MAALFRRSMIVCLLATTFGPTLAVGQAQDTPDISELQSYVASFSLVRLPETGDPALTTEEIIDSFEQLRGKGELEIVETVRLSVLEHHESQFQVSRQVPVTVASTQSPVGGRGTVRQIQTYVFGTTARVEVTRVKEKLMVELNFESERPEGEIGNERPPSSVTTSLQTTMLIQPGRQVLVGGTSDDSTFVFLSVETK